MITSLRGLSCALSACLAALGVAAALVPGAAPAARVRVAATTAPCATALVPAYISPADTVAWNRLITSTQPGGMVTINPASGPGTGPDRAYAAAAERARAAGLTVLGYAHTSYGARPASEVKAEIDQYRKWYGVTSIFFDETATSASALTYYRALANRVRTNRGLVVLNPGVTPDRRYADLADVVVTFEGDAATYASEPAPPAWTAGYPSSRFAQLVYAAAAADLDTVRSRAAARHASRLYVTDDVMVNPWDTLPSYYEREAATLTAGCAA